MFNKNFYPTPYSLVQIMIEPYKEEMKKGSLILEPSAGKGDIASQLKNISRNVKLHMIELEPELQEICKKY